MPLNQAQAHAASVIVRPQLRASILARNIPDTRSAADAAFGILRRATPPALLRGAHQVADLVPPLRRLRQARRLRHRMQAALGYMPDLNRPQTFNERVAHKILHDRNPLIPLTTDKVAVRDYVAARVGPDLLLPQFGVWDRAADIPWEELPDRFALKASHGWQMNLLVRDKAATNRGEALRTADRWLQESHFEHTGEWGYQGIRPRLLAEMLIEGERPSSVPEDFKFYVFRGQPRLLEVHVDRGTTDYGFLFYAPDDLRQLPSFGGSWQGDSPYRLPPATRELVDIAARLGADFEFVRVDLYMAAGRAWFGELTHYPASACVRVAGIEQDRLLGDIWAGKA